MSDPDADAPETAASTGSIGARVSRTARRESGDGASSARAPTIIDVARRAAVSKSLVSRVMRGETTWISTKTVAAVRAAAAELGYRPNAVARSLVQRRSFNVGVVISDLRNLFSYTFFADVLDGIGSVARTNGYHVLLTTGNRDPEAETADLEKLLELRTDGVLLIDTSLSADVVLSASRSVPVVLVRSLIRVDGVDTIVTNDARGAELAVEHLVGLGHRHIALISGRWQRAAERRRGYRAAMRRLGLEDTIQVATDDVSYTEEGGYRAALQLLASRPRPTAICASNDLAAVGALNAIVEAGLCVPDDISLVGYDNTAIAALRHLSLTTVDQPRRQIGEEAMRLLMSRMVRPDSPARKLVLEPSLVVRTTTAPPPSA